MEIIHKNRFQDHLLNEDDLISRLGLNPEDVEKGSALFVSGKLKYKGREIIFSHSPDDLVISTEGKEDLDLKRMVESFSNVVGYRPFCKYKIIIPNNGKEKSFPTYEWDKINPGEKYSDLEKTPYVGSLIKLN